MWFVLKNIKLSGIFNVYIFYFILIVTSNNNTSSNPVSTTNKPPDSETESISTDTANNLNNNYESQSEVSTINDAPKNSNKFPFNSMSSIVQALKNSTGIKKKPNQTTSDNPDIAVEENPFQDMTLGLNDESLDPSSSTKLEDQQNTVDKNYGVGESDQLNQWAGYENYYEDDYNTDKEENLKTIQLMQDSAQNKFPLENGKVGTNDQLSQSPIYSDQEPQKTADEININSQDGELNELNLSKNLEASGNVESNNLVNPEMETNQDILNQIKQSNSDLEQKLSNDDKIDVNNDALTGDKTKTNGQDGELNELNLSKNLKTSGNVESNNLVNPEMETNPEILNQIELPNSDLEQKLSNDDKIDVNNDALTGNETKTNGQDGELNELNLSKNLETSGNVESNNLVNPEMETNPEILNQIELPNSDLEQKLSNDDKIDVNNDELTGSTGPSSSETPQKNTNLISSNNVNGGKKKKKVPYKLEYTGDARVLCTFGTQVRKMYKKVRKHFVDGELCHAIVLGNPLIIRERRVSISDSDHDELRDVHAYKNVTLLVVIMQHSTYEDWSRALKTPQKEVKIIMNVVEKYKIDGIQFSNLEPSPGDQLDTEMNCRLVQFFEMLTKAAEAQKKELKIGITLSPFAQSVSTGFQKFKVLNDLVSWYLLHTVSMVQCSPAHMQGTSPLKGPISVESAFLQLMKTDIRKNKIILSIQLYANKFDSLEPHTYREMCSLEKESWNEWCAARPEDFRKKGEFLRNLEIWGVQLYYMESDDYKALCDCYTFPMIRALLRGMAQKGPLEEKCEYLGEVENQRPQCSYEGILQDIETRLERQYNQAQGLLENAGGT